MVLILIQMGFAGTLPLLHAKSTCWNRHMVTVFNINGSAGTHPVHIRFRTRKVPPESEISDGGSYYNMADRLKGSSFVSFVKHSLNTNDL